MAVVIFQMSVATVYQIVVADSASDLYTFGVPTASDTPHVIYRTLAQAQSALLEFVRKFEKFTPVAYGDAYPYENTSFEALLQEKGAAPYGWAYIQDEDDDRPSRVGIFILSLRLTN
jgi:hypothetical protein